MVAAVFETGADQRTIAHEVAAFRRYGRTAEVPVPNPVHAQQFLHDLRDGAPYAVGHDLDDGVLGVQGHGQASGTLSGTSHSRERI